MNLDLDLAAADIHVPRNLDIGLVEVTGEHPEQRSRNVIEGYGKATQIVAERDGACGRRRFHEAAKNGDNRPRRDQRLKAGRVDNTRDPMEQLGLGIQRVEIRRSPSRVQGAAIVSQTPAARREFIPKDVLVIEAKLLDLPARVERQQQTVEGNNVYCV